MKREKSCGAVLFTRKDGRICYVLVQQLDGFYGFPKGHMEAGETEQETAMREILEEVHLVPALIDGFRVADEYPVRARGSIKEVVFFLGEYADQEITIQKEELKSAHLMTYEDAMQVLDFDSKRNILRQAHEFLAENGIL